MIGEDARLTQLKIHIRVYLGNLYESQRYLGKSDLAADYAKELGQAWEAAGNAMLATRFARLSQIVREGEPVLRVVAHCDGKVLELDEVELQPTMKLEMHFWRNRPGLPGATKRIERGKELAGKRQYDEALELFREAANIDPYEPDAHYQAGMVLCEQQLYPQAVEEYETCESLAPGWYFCRSDLWVAKQLALGVMPHEVFLGMRFLQDGPTDMCSMTSCQVRVASFGSVALRYTLASPRLMAGWRSASFMAATFCSASAFTRVLRLTELPVTLSKAYHMPQARLNFRYRCVISSAFIL